MNTLRTRAVVGRADLLRVYAEYGEEALELAALALGYERLPALVAASAYVTVSHNAKFVVDTGPPPLPERPAALPAARFFHVTEHRQSDPPPGSGPEAPDWLANARVLAEDACPAPGSVRIPVRQPLTRWSRLWPFLRRALGQTVASRQPDLPRLLDRLTRGEVLRAIPMLKRHGWSRRIALLADYSRPTIPFHGDFNALGRALERRHGRLGLDRRILYGEPGAQPLLRARCAAWFIFRLGVGNAALAGAGGRDAAIDPQRPRTDRPRPRDAAWLAAIRRPTAQRGVPGAGPLSGARAPVPGQPAALF